MLRIKKRPPIDYRMCSQKVTIYHKIDDFTYKRTVYENAFLDFKKNRTIDKTGSREVNSFLLIIPGEDVKIFPSDKVYLGEGKRITDSKEWSEFIPSKVSGLVVVKDVDPKFWNGKQIHIEAGG